jgi:hypothetical protein
VLYTVPWGIFLPLPSSGASGGGHQHSLQISLKDRSGGRSFDSQAWPCVNVLAIVILF